MNAQMPFVSPKNFVRSLTNQATLRLSRPLTDKYMGTKDEEAINSSGS